MKFLQLEFEGFFSQAGKVDFSKTKQNMSVLHGVNKNQLKNLILKTIFGAEGDVSQISCPASISFLFEHDEVAFLLTRKYTEQGGAVLEETTLALANGGVELATDADADAYLQSMVGLDSESYALLLFTERGEINTAFTTDAALREQFVAGELDRITSASAIVERIENLNSQAEQIDAELGETAVVTQEMLDEHNAAILTAEGELEEVQNEMRVVADGLVKAKRYEDGNEAYAAEVTKLEKLQNDKEKMQVLAERIAKSRAAEELRSVYREYMRIQTEIETEKSGLDEKQQQYQVHQQKFEAGEKSAQDYAQKFMQKNERAFVLTDELIKHVQATAANPQSYLIYDKIDSYYTELDTQKDELVARRNQVDEEIAALNEDIAVLHQKKADLHYDASMRQTVGEAALYATSMELMMAEMEGIEERIAQYEAEHARLYEQHTELVADIEARTAVQEPLYQAVRGGYNSFKEAINADALYQQTLYAKHLLVSRQEVELKAVREKIERVNQQYDNYRTKLEAFRTDQQNIMQHLDYMQERLRLLQAKRNEYESHNLMRKTSDELQLGSNCPICDGFVTTKRNIAQKDTKALDAQIEAAQTELEKTQKAILRVNTSIGQYEATAKVSGQYLESLANTRDGLKESIIVVLEEYGVASVAELFGLLRDAVDRYKKRLSAQDEYRINEVALQAAHVENNTVVDRLNTLADELISKDKARRDELNARMEDAMSRYADQSEETELSAQEMLERAQVLDEEFHKLEAELSTKQGELDLLYSEKHELETDINRIITRAVPIRKGGKTLEYPQVVAKTIMGDIQNITSELANENKELDRIKTKLAAVRKVAANSKEQADALKQEIDAANLKIEALQSVGDSVLGRYKSSFEALNVQKEEDLDVLIINQELIKEYEDQLVVYDSAVQRQELNTKRLQEEREENLTYYTAKDELTAHFAQLKEVEETILLNKKELAARLAEDENDYRNRLMLEKQKEVLAEKIQKMAPFLEMLDADGALVSGAFADYVVAKAGENVAAWSEGRYALTATEDGVELYNQQKEKSVPAIKYTQEEKTLVEMGLSFAHLQAVEELMAGETLHMLPLGEEETNKSTLRVLVEASKAKASVLLVPSEEEAEKIDKMLA